MLDRLVEARLCTVEGMGEDESTVEIAHESLIDRWPLLSRWLDEEHANARFRERLRRAAREWEESGRAEGLLWRGQAAEEVRRFQGRLRHAEDGLLGAREAAFAATVTAAGDRRARGRRRAVAATIAGLAATAVIVSLLGLRAHREAVRADQQAGHAERARLSAEESARRSRDASRLAAARERQADPTLVLALLREIESRPAPPGKRLETAMDDFNGRIANADGTGASIALRGHGNQLRAAAWSPDGRRVLTGGNDETLRIWSADPTGRTLILRGHDQPVTAAEWSPDGKRLASSSEDMTVRVWSADGREPPIVLRGHEASCGSHGSPWSPDGARVATHSDDATVRLWSADGAGAPVVLRSRDAPFNSASWSPDGRRIAAAADDNTVWVWSDLDPIESPDDPRLWAASTYCPPVALRLSLLDVPEPIARADLARCEARVRAAGAR